MASSSSQPELLLPEAEASTSHLAAESQNLDEELTCGICMEILDNPYSIIPCLHSLDYDCLVEWWQTHNTCPVCAQKSRSAKRSFQLRAIVEKYLATRPHKRRPVDPEHDPQAAHATPAEIKPQGENLDYPAFVDEDEDDEEEEEDWDPHAGRLVWPCFCCEPGNRFGYECPSPIPEPTAEEQAQAIGQFGQALGGRLERHVNPAPIDIAVQRGIPGAVDHADCSSCARYIPKHRQPLKDQCAHCERWTCADYDPEGCPAEVTWCLQPRDNCDFTHLPNFADLTLLNLWLRMPSFLARNPIEMKIFDDYVTTSGVTYATIYRDLCEAKLQELERDDNGDPQFESLIKRKYGADTHSCLTCRNVIIQHGLLQWWKQQRRTANLDPAILAKPDCWYGDECRTQTHNEVHARKLNHVCDNTRRGQPGPNVLQRPAGWWGMPM